jgi:hypothetical protein
MSQRVDLVLKLLAFALDPAGQIGEAENAAARMVGIARREGITLPTIVSALSTVRYIEPDDEPPACQIIIDFGKHAGLTLGEVAQIEPSYVNWLIENVTGKRELVSAAKVVAEYYGIETPDEVHA